MNLKEMNEKREQLVAQARAALDEIKGNTDESRAAELEQRHDAIMAEFDRIESVIEREEKLARFEQRMEERRREQRPVNEGEARAQEEAKAPEYRAVFYKLLANGGDVGELEAAERKVLRDGVSELRIQTTTGGSGAAGGYTVPVELANQIVKSMKAHGPMYDPGVTTEIATASGHQINIPTVDDTAKVAGAHTEGVQLTDDGSEDVVFGQKRLDAYVFDTEWVRFSMELAQDSIFNVENLLGELLGERFGRTANTQLTTGSGTNAPQGISGAAALGVTAASATAITGDELINLVHSVDPAYRTGPKVAFMMNDSTLAAIRRLKDGQGNYLWQMGNVQQGVPASLLGYRIHVNQAMASIAATNRTILFGDFAKYYVRKVGAPVVGVVRERFWPDLGIAGLIRFDGELLDSAAVKYLRQL
jgi:HK97 family phage major capsid protein